MPKNSRVSLDGKQNAKKHRHKVAGFDMAPTVRGILEFVFNTLGRLPDQGPRYGPDIRGHKAEWLGCYSLEEPAILGG